MTHKVFLNGRLIPEKEAAIPITDRGFLYGDGVYETIRIYDGKPFLLSEHLRRLNVSLHGIQLIPSLSLIDIGRAVQRVVRANELKEGVARVTITRGSGPRGFDVTGCRKPTLLVTAAPMSGPAPEAYRKGIVAAVVSIRRTAPDALPPDLKSNNALNQILARMEATALGAGEALLLNPAGQLAEGSASNVFVIKNGAVLTPRADGHVLAGTTRAWVLRLAREAGYPADERRLSVADLAAADEVFLTNVTWEIMPVSRLIFNHGKARRWLRLGPYARTSGYIGPVTLDLQARFRASVRLS